MRVEYTNLEQIRNLPVDKLMEQAVQVHVPKGKPIGTVLFLSDYRRTNFLFGEDLSANGYETITGITVSDVEDIIFPQYSGDFNAVAFSSIVHIIHHRGEESYSDIFPENVEEWQSENIKRVIRGVEGRQGTPFKPFIEKTLIYSPNYHISPDDLIEFLRELGVEYGSFQLTGTESPDELRELCVESGTFQLEGTESPDELRKILRELIIESGTFQLGDTKTLSDKLKQK